MTVADTPNTSTPPDTPGVIYSRLTKASYLVGNSTVFPQLVEAACTWQEVPASPDVVRWCATRPTILDALQMTEDTALDDVLRGFARDPDTAETMDQLILTAVQEYKETT